MRHNEKPAIGSQGRPKTVMSRTSLSFPFSSFEIFPPRTNPPPFVLLILGRLSRAKKRFTILKKKSLDDLRIPPFRDGTCGENYDTCGGDGLGGGGDLFLFFFLVYFGRMRNLVCLD